MEIFDQYSKIKDDVSKEIFVRKSIVELMKIPPDDIGEESAEFKQNAVLMISSLYFSKKIDKYDLESNHLDELDGSEKEILASILREELD